VQISSAKSTVKMESSMSERVENRAEAIRSANTGVFFDFNGAQGSVRARFADTDTQFKAKDILEKTLNPDATDPTYSRFQSVAEHTEVAAKSECIADVPRSGFARWRAFLMQVDTKAVLTNGYRGCNPRRSVLREKDIRHAGISRDGDNISVKFRDAETRPQRSVIASQMTGNAVQNLSQRITANSTVTQPEA
jgi:preprotein translocase subunit SecD